MVVRAVAAVLTAEEQAMNPTPHPRQRRTRPGDWTYSEKKSDKEINVVTVECRKWFEIVCGFFSSVLCVKLRNLCQSINSKKANVELVFSRAFYWLCGLIFFGFSLVPHAFYACYDWSFWSLVYIYTNKALEMFDLTQLFYGLLFLNVFNISMILLLLIFLYFSISWIHYKQFDHFASPKSLCCS